MTFSYIVIQKSIENDLKLFNINSYIQNALSTFIGRCLEKRWAFIKDTIKNPLSTTLITGGP